MSINRSKNIENNSRINQHSKDSGVYHYPMLFDDYNYNYNIDYEKRMIAEKMNEKNTMNYHCNPGLNKGRVRFRNIVIENNNNRNRKKPNYNEWVINSVVLVQKDDCCILNQKHILSSITYNDNYCKTHKNEFIKSSNKKKQETMNNSSSNAIISSKPQFIIASLNEVNKKKTILPSIPKETKQKQLDKIFKPKLNFYIGEENKSTIMHTISREVSKLEKMYLNQQTQKIHHEKNAENDSNKNVNHYSDNKNENQNRYSSNRDKKMKYSLKNTNDNKKLNVLVKRMKG